MLYRLIRHLLKRTCSMIRKHRQVRCCRHFSGCLSGNGRRPAQAILHATQASESGDPPPPTSCLLFYSSTAL